ncbi:unnamed protein product [Protopolystoma xenopodis]|uniref:Interferon regulatory factor 2-binding protein 1/2-like C3HC4 zinc finger domain-containing protein n=1 Tax=Protopolystoma xenopodis TaxID=117903 RepID=A0A3S5BL10_9PLAT|nr:unnamed protein product [Protopolystoma xenopodis]
MHLGLPGWLAWLAETGLLVDADDPRQRPSPPDSGLASSADRPVGAIVSAESGEARLEYEVAPNSGRWASLEHLLASLDHLHQQQHRLRLQHQQVMPVSQTLPLHALANHSRPLSPGSLSHQPQRHQQQLLFCPPTLQAQFRQQRPAILPVFSPAPVTGARSGDHNGPIGLGEEWPLTTPSTSLPMAAETAWPVGERLLGQSADGRSPFGCGSLFVTPRKRRALFCSLAAETITSASSTSSTSALTSTPTPTSASSSLDPSAIRAAKEARTDATTTTAPPPQPQTTLGPWLGVHCSLCVRRLEGSHFVQCPAVAKHRFCFDCARAYLLRELRLATCAKSPSTVQMNANANANVDAEANGDSDVDADGDGEEGSAWAAEEVKSDGDGQTEAGVITTSGGENVSSGRPHQRGLPPSSSSAPATAPLTASSSPSPSSAAAAKTVSPAPGNSSRHEIFCPSGQRCVLPGSRAPWAFISAEITAILGRPVGAELVGRAGLSAAASLKERRCDPRPDSSQEAEAEPARESAQQKEDLDGRDLSPGLVRLTGRPGDIEVDLGRRIGGPGTRPAAVDAAKTAHPRLANQSPRPDDSGGPSSPTDWKTPVSMAASQSLAKLAATLGAGRPAAAFASLGLGLGLGLGKTERFSVQPCLLSP